MGRAFRRSTDEDTQKFAFNCCAAAVIVSLLLSLWLSWNGLFGKLWLVVWRNQAYPITLVLLVGFGFFWKLRHMKEFTWGELGVYCVMIPIVTFPFAATGYYYLTDLHDREVWNGYATKVQYHEAWTQRVTTTDSKGRTRTTYVYHPPQWSLHTNNKESVSLSSAEYRSVAALFGTQKFHNLFHVNQSSFGDGNMDEAIWNGTTAKNAFVI